MKKRNQLNKLEQRLLDSEVGDGAARLTVCSSTPIDTGRWLRRTPAWICVMAEELVLFAASRRRYFERIAIDQCSASFYNHTTGELVIEPGESLRLNRFEVSPGEAIRILNFLNIKP